MLAIRDLCAVVVGSYIGAFLALMLNIFTWWIGALLGGGLSWLLVELDRVTAAVPFAWQKATSQRAREQLRWFFSTWFIGAFVIGSYAIPFCMLMFTTTAKPGYWREGVFFGFMFGSAPSILFGLLFTSSGGRAPDPDARFCSVAVLFYWIPRAIYKARGAIYEALAAIWRYARHPYLPEPVFAAVAIASAFCILIARFCRYLFVLVHSQKRSTAFYVSALSVTIGYAFGNAFIAAGVSIPLWFASRELVAKRWLKVVPSGS